MFISEDISYDEIIVGSAQTIKDITFIPIYDVCLGSAQIMGTFCAASINPKAFFSIDKRGEMTILKLDKAASYNFQ